MYWGGWCEEVLIVISECTLSQTAEDTTTHIHTNRRLSQAVETWATDTTNAGSLNSRRFIRNHSTHRPNASSLFYHSLSMHGIFFFWTKLFPPWYSLVLRICSCYVGISPLSHMCTFVSNPKLFLRVVLNLDEYQRAGITLAIAWIDKVSGQVSGEP